MNTYRNSHAVLLAAIGVSALAACANATRSGMPYAQGSGASQSIFGATSDEPGRPPRDSRDWMDNAELRVGP